MTRSKIEWSELSRSSGPADHLSCGELLEFARARNETSSDDSCFDRQYVYEFEEALTLGILALAEEGAHA